MPPPEDETDLNLPYGPWLRAWDDFSEGLRNKPMDGRHGRVEREDREKNDQAPDKGSGTNEEWDVDSKLQKLAEV